MKYNKVTITSYEEDQCRSDLEEREVDFNLASIKQAICEMLGEEDEDGDDWRDPIGIELEYRHDKFTKTAHLYGDVESMYAKFVASIELSESLVDAFERVRVNESHNDVVIGTYPNHVKFVIMMSERGSNIAFINDITRKFNGPYTAHKNVNDVVPYLADISLKL